jgi:hypothetical protein
MVGSMRLGEGRQELYARAKSLGVTLSSSGRVVLGKQGPHVDVRDFPLPRLGEPNPSVVAYFAHADGWMLWTVDKLSVMFDANGRVTRWKVDPLKSGV